MPLLGNPTAAVFYPGKVVFALLPYAWAARVYIVVHSALAFAAMIVLMRSWGTTWFGSALAGLGYAFGAPILFQYCNIIFLIGAAWLPLGIHAVDRWVRRGQRWGVLELATVLSMQMLGGDPQAAYLVGLAGIGYALGLAWTRARSLDGEKGSVESRRSSPRLSLLLAACSLVVWCAVTLAVAQWLPKLRETGGPPTPPLWWMLWAPLAAAVAAGILGLLLLVRWWKRGWRFPLGFMCLGLASAAALAIALTAVQLFPVVEFTQRTARAAEGGTHEIYLFGIEPYRLIEMAWPTILGEQFAGNTSWAAIFKIPGVRPKVWVPSLYAGGLTFVLALSSMAFRHGPPWRVWFSVIVVVSLVGSLGQYTSPIWVARAVAASTKSPTLQKWLQDLGGIDPGDTTPIREDGYLRDGDGGFYWWLSTLLPGFRQFRFPAKLFTFTTLGLAVLAGLGWDRVAAGRNRGAFAFFFAFVVISLTALAAVVYERETILASFGSLEGGSLFGPFDSEGAYQAILRSLRQATIVFGLGAVLVLVARRRPDLAGAAAVIIMTTDLAAANARFVLTVPQSLLESKPEVLKIIEAAERDNPKSGPFRIHRMPIWSPLGWHSTRSKDRVFELVSWEHDTMQPKHGINHGVEYTHTLGVAELYDYDWYFNGFPRKVRDPEFARSLGVELEKEVVYFPRRAYDMWNTRYLVIPYWHAGWRDEYRGYASFVFETQRIYPDADRFRTTKGGEEQEKNWMETYDFKVLRNLQEYPRAWVVHNARMTLPISGLSRATRSEAFQEILHAGDRLWNDSTQHVYDPRNLAWVSNEDMFDLRKYLSGEKTRTSESVKVSYPDPQNAVLDVTLDSPGLVILADIYYPGWELKIDGQPAPVYRVNGAMRGAAVAKGPHRLVYTYAPRSFRVGGRVSMAGLAVLLLMGLVFIRWPVDPLLGAGVSSG
jgi:Bacterial membrane protein YfhO